MIRAATLCACALFAVIGGWLWTYQNPYAAEHLRAAHVANWLVFGGIVLAFATFELTRLVQARASATQNTLTALQSLRTDRDYLDQARLVKARIGQLDRPINHDLLALLLAADQPPPDGLSQTDRDFAIAVDFLLNQYEFLAAGVRIGAMDRDMLRLTIRSTILALGLTLQPYIKAQRTQRPAQWENFVMLYRAFARGDAAALALCLGPVPR